jgi:hypothetical protein
VCTALYTPGYSRGIPVNNFDFLQTPQWNGRENEDSLREKIQERFALIDTGSYKESTLYVLGAHLIATIIEQVGEQHHRLTDRPDFAHSIPPITHRGHFHG